MTLHLLWFLHISLSYLCLGKEKGKKNFKQLSSSPRSPLLSQPARHLAHWQEHSSKSKEVPLNQDVVSLAFFMMLMYISLFSPPLPPSHPVFWVWDPFYNCPFNTFSCEFLNLLALGYAALEAATPVLESWVGHLPSISLTLRKPLLHGDRLRLWNKGKRLVMNKGGHLSFLQTPSEEADLTICPLLSVTGKE